MTISEFGLQLGTTPRQPIGHTNCLDIGLWAATWGRRGGNGNVSGHAVVPSRHVEPTGLLASRDPAPWMRTYLRRAVILDCCCALAAGLLALGIGFDSTAAALGPYLLLTLSLPAFLLSSVPL